QSKTGRVEKRASAEHRRRTEAIRQSAREWLRRAPQQHLDGKRQREHVAAPTICARHRREEKSEAGARPEPDGADQTAAHQNERKLARELKTVDGRRSADCARLVSHRAD